MHPSLFVLGDPSFPAHNTSEAHPLQLQNVISTILFCSLLLTLGFHIVVVVVTQYPNIPNPSSSFDIASLHRSHPLNLSCCMHRSNSFIRFSRSYVKLITPHSVRWKKKDSILLFQHCPTSGHHAFILRSEGVSSFNIGVPGRGS